MRDYLVFVGATPSLSTELLTLRSRLSVTVIAEASTKNKRGGHPEAISRAISGLIRAIRSSDKTTVVGRLSVWMHAETGDRFDQLWNEVGRYGWVELIPSTLIDKNLQTRQYIEQRYHLVRECLHEISNELYSHRRRSPFSLPLRNFESKILYEFQKPWYANYTVQEVKKNINKIIQ